MSVFEWFSGILDDVNWIIYYVFNEDFYILLLFLWLCIDINEVNKGNILVLLNWLVLIYVDY